MLVVTATARITQVWDSVAGGVVVQCLAYGVVERVEGTVVEEDVYTSRVVRNVL